MTRTMLITGASRGLGAAVARLAAQQDYRIAINYLHSDEAAKNLEAELIALGADAHAIKADVSTEEGVVHLFHEVDRQFGRLDVLIANSGISGPMVSIEQIDQSTLEAVMRANFSSVVLCTREAVRRMSNKNDGAGGSIVIMSSIAARLGGSTGMLAYTASKGAADSFTLAMARELAGTGIRINSLRPGMIETSIHDVYGGAATLSAAAPTIPLRRVGRPDEVAEAVLFLASDKSSYVHGAFLDVSGGR